MTLFCRMRVVLSLLTVAATVTAAAGTGGVAQAGTRTSLSPPPSPLAGVLDALGPRAGQPTQAAGRARPARPKLRPADMGPLPLGRPGLQERRTTTRLAAGVTLTEIRRGQGRAPRRKIGTTARGPWRVDVLLIDPAKADGQLASTFGPTVARTERTTTLAREAHALAGVNGSFFSLTLSRRYPGIPVGLTINDGRVLSEPTGRSAEVTLAVDSLRNRVRIGLFDWSGEVRARSGAGVLDLDRVNSAPHVPASCRHLRHPSRCTKPGQLTSFTADFARHTPSGPGLEVVLDRTGCVQRIVTERGVHLHGAQTSLQATGRAARRLRELAGGGCVQVDNALRDQAGSKLTLRPGVSAVTGRYRLLRHGKVAVPHRRLAFFHRHPRTIAGVDYFGRLMLVTIDGRQGRSVGTTLLETARVARALGMRDAVNLDGGGSTTMAVRGHLVNHPSGAERAVSDALVWLAARD
jgi:hypothetical protein